MKMKRYLLFLVIVICISCKKEKSVKHENFNLVNYITSYKLDKELNDSLLKSKLSGDITKTANLNQNYYYIVQYQKYFKNKYKYLVVWDQLNNIYYWFLEHNNSFIKFFQRESSVNFINDTIADFNHDGNYELGIKFRTTGPDITSIHFIDPNNGLIKDTIDIIDHLDIGNNQFIQVVNHQSPIVYFSKCKWNNTKIDTIEQIMFDTNDISKFYIFKNDFPFKNKNDVLTIDESKTLKTISRLPADYKKSLAKFYPSFRSEK